MREGGREGGREGWGNGEREVGEGGGGGGGEERERERERLAFLACFVRLTLHDIGVCIARHKVCIVNAPVHIYICISISIRATKLNSGAVVPRGSLGDSGPHCVRRYLWYL